MNKNIFSIVASLSLTTVPMSTSAYQITFTGQINASSCTVASGGLGLAMQLPTISVDDVKSVGAHAGAQTLRIPIECPGATGGEAVTVALKPIVGSIVGDYVIKNTASFDAAENVGIVILNKDNELVSFMAGPTVLEETLDNTGKVDFFLSAAYAKTGVPTAGNVTAILPFSISYK